MDYDVIIIGAGAAGLTAAIYSARYNLKTLVITKTGGGIAATADRVCNYPSYKDIGGIELMERFIEHTESLGVTIVYEEVKKITKKKDYFIVETIKNNYKSKKIIFSVGSERNKLNVPGEEKFNGKGVSYCATCDAPLFRDKIVAVVGGGDAALTAALLIAKYAKKVYIIHRNEKFTSPEPMYVDLIKKYKKIEVFFNEEVKEIKGNTIVNGLKLKSGKELKVDGIFIEIGSTPNLSFIKSLGIRVDKRGYIIADKKQRTNIKGFFAAGDVVSETFEQIVVVAGQGSIAANSAYEEITQEER